MSVTSFYSLAIVLLFSGNLCASTVFLIKNSIDVRDPRDIDLVTHSLSLEGLLEEEPTFISPKELIYQGFAKLHSSYRHLAEKNSRIFTPELVDEICENDKELPPGHASYYLVLLDEDQKTMLGFTRILVTRKHHLTNVDGHVKPIEGGTQLIGIEKKYPQLTSILPVSRYEIGRVWTIDDGKYRFDYLAEMYLAILQVIHDDHRDLLKHIEMGKKFNLNGGKNDPVLVMTLDPTLRFGEMMEINPKKLVESAYTGPKDTAIIAEAGPTHARFYRLFGLTHEIANAEQLNKIGTQIIGTDLEQVLYKILNPYNLAIQNYKDGYLKSFNFVFEDLPSVMHFPLRKLQAQLAIKMNEIQLASNILKDLRNRHPQDLGLIALENQF